MTEETFEEMWESRGKAKVEEVVKSYSDPAQYDTLKVYHKQSTTRGFWWIAIVMTSTPAVAITTAIKMDCWGKLSPFGGDVGYTFYTVEEWEKKEEKEKEEEKEEKVEKVEKMEKMERMEKEKEKDGKDGKDGKEEKEEMYSLSLSESPAED